jgi:hypothetical protein
MNIAVHPPAVKPGVWTIVCDNFIVGKGKAEKLHQCPQEIMVV